MPRTVVYIIGDDIETVEKAESFFGAMGVPVMNYKHQHWKDGLEHHGFRAQLSEGPPALVGGSGTVSNVVPITKNETPVPFTSFSTIEEMETKAILSAVRQFRGNLSEAAKALGIGRATLYRKVGQLQIDLAQARKKTAA